MISVFSPLESIMQIKEISKLKIEPGEALDLISIQISGIALTLKPLLL